MRNFLILAARAATVTAPPAARAHSETHHAVNNGFTDWTKEAISAFFDLSDAKIDKWAGRSVAPGEIIWHEGMPFMKSTVGAKMQMVPPAAGVPRQINRIE